MRPAADKQRPAAGRQAPPFFRMEVAMSTFDSPLARCEALREMVLTDQTQAECAHEHGCPPGSPCPLCGWFAEPGECAKALPPALEKMP